MDNTFDETIALNIISNVGMAKSMYINAISKAKEGQIEEAKQMMAEGKNYYLEGHKAHAELISESANMQDYKVSLLILHAEDQLSSAEMAEEMANEIIALYELLKQKEIL